MVNNSTDIYNHLSYIFVFLAFVRFVDRCIVYPFLIYVFRVSIYRQSFLTKY